MYLLSTNVKYCFLRVSNYKYLFCLCFTFQCCPFFSPLCFDVYFFCPFCFAVCWVISLFQRSAGGWKAAEKRRVHFAFFQLYKNKAKKMPLAINWLGAAAAPLSLTIAKILCVFKALANSFWMYTFCVYPVGGREA